VASTREAFQEGVLATRITDGSALGQRLHIRCDKCGAEVAVRLGLDKRPIQDRSGELIGWRRGIAERDLCPACQEPPA
jgi:hypothetical protein